MAPALLKTTTPPTSELSYSLPSPPPSSPRHRPLLPGVYAPTCCFFDANGDVDTAAIAAHVIRLAHADITGITTQGSNGEAVHLSGAERSLVTATTRQTLDAAGYGQVPIIAGCGAQSTRETVQLCSDARDAGADYALVLAPAYFSASYSRQDLLEHYLAVADASEIPLLVYNYPAAAAGLDLDSDFLIELSRHPNIVGAKLTCGNVGKLNRLASATAGSKSSKSAGGAATAAAAATGALSPSYVTLAGSADILVSALVAGGSGALAGLANLAPRASMACFRAFVQGDLQRACQLQAVLARADWALQKSGVPGVKAGLQAYFDYGGSPRRPLKPLGEEERLKLEDDLVELMALEKAL